MQWDHFINLYNSLDLLIPNTQFIPPTGLFPLVNHKSVPYICESASVFTTLKKIITQFKIQWKLKGGRWG